jgi:cell wall-associated NlpC family hydrolase
MSQRQRVVTEAETWLRTPYHHMGRIKGGGTDCLMLLAEVYEAAGVIRHLDVPFYPPD